MCSEHDNCNDKPFQVENCYKLDYQTSNPIMLNDTRSVNCLLTMNPMGCYHFERNEYVEKGCISDLNQQKQNEYKNSVDCELCFQKNCNSKVVRELRCYHCDNSTNINCAEPTELTTPIDYSHYSSSCLIGIDKNGFTHRSWGSNQTYDSQRFPGGFETCLGSSCNSQIYPRDRLKCIQCHGNAQCHMKASDSEEKLQPKVCNIYNRDDFCFTYSDGMILMNSYLSTFSIQFCIIFDRWKGLSGMYKRQYRDTKAVRKNW